MLTVKQAAAALGMSATFVRDEYHAGRLAGYRFGAAIRFDHATVDAYRKSKLPPEPRQLSMRDIRELERLRRRAAEVGCDIPPLPADLLALAESRYRRMRMPPWANSAAIKAIYAEAKRKTAVTGVEHHVDHIIPLVGERVSGLHVETNLQVLSKADNLRKRNRFEGCP
jgi:excisionase family DNA binding protein